MQKYKYITLLFVVLFLVGCAKDDFITIGDSRGEKAVYGFGVGGGTTRTFINDDGVTISWDKDDKVALWAKKDNAFVLNNQEFKNWFITADKSQAFFTAELASQMAVGEYQYYVTYPKPASVSGTTATFNLPSTQDGKMGGGADIMVAQGTGPALAKLYIPAPEEGEKTEGDPNYVLDQNRLSLNMHHLIHALRFYVPQGKWGFPQGETVERIVLTMPQNIAGMVKTDVANTNGGLTLDSNGSKTIALSLAEDLVASTSGDMNYAVAAILPPSTKYVANDKLVVKTYSQTRVATQEISLNGRGPQAEDERMRMAAGRVTPVGLDCSTTSERPKISFRIANNYLGEQPYKITLTSKDSNTKWKAGDDHIYEYYTGSESSTIAEDGGFDIYCDDVTSIWGQQITVTYESKSAVVSEVISSIPAISNGTTHNVSLNVPYLLYENFDSVSGFNSNDEHIDFGTNKGTKDGYPFLNGWSGGRIGAQVGTAIRLACRRETSEDYPARVDSAPLNGLKDGKSVTLSILFDCGMNRETYGINAPKVGQTCYLGYVKNNNNPIASGRNFYVYGLDGQEGEFPHNFFINETGASYTNISHKKNYGYTLSGCDNTTRLTWLTTNEHKSGASNATVWLYIDNVRVQIVP